MTDEKRAKASASVDPATPDEWQSAVDGAHAFLLLESVRLYGLIEGGPKVNVGRCEELLDRGKERGFTPAPDAWEELLGEVGVEPLSKCCSAPIHVFDSAIRRGRPAKHRGRPYCSKCRKWCDAASEEEK